MLLQAEGGAEPRVETAKAARGLGAGVFELRLLLVGRLPAENRHRDAIGATQITLHLLLQISKRIETQIVVETLLVISVTSLDFAVVPRCSWADQLVFNLIVSTEHIKRMRALGFSKVGKFSSIVCLNRLGSVAEEDNSSFYKVYGGIAAIFLVRINKAFS